jgi:hypothetical protein
MPMFQSAVALDCINDITKNLSSFLTSISAIHEYKSEMRHRKKDDITQEDAAA